MNVLIILYRVRSSITVVEKEDKVMNWRALLAVVLAQGSMVALKTGIGVNRALDWSH